MRTAALGGQVLLVMLVAMVAIVMVVVAILARRIVDVPIVVPETARGQRRYRRGENEGCRETRCHAPLQSTARAGRRGGALPATRRRDEALYRPQERFQIDRLEHERSPMARRGR